MTDRIDSTAQPPLRPARRAWKALVRPGAQLMASLRLSGKLALMMAVMSVPMAYLVVGTTADLMHKKGLAQGVEEATHISEAAIDTYAALQRLRALNIHLLQGGGPQVEAAVQQQRRTVMEKLDAVDAQWERSSHLSRQHIWPGLRQRAQALARGIHARNADEAAAQFGELLADLQDYTLVVVERSEMGTAIGPLGQTLGQVVTGPGFALAAAAAELQALGSRTLAQKEPVTLAQRSQVLGHAASLDNQQFALEKQLGLAQRHDKEAGSVLVQVQAAVKALLQDTQRRFGAAQVQGSADAYFDLSDLVLQQAFGVQRDALQRLRGVAQERQAQIVRSAARLGGIYLLGALIIGYLAMTFYVSFHNALRQVLQGMKATAEGDLSRQVLIRGKDELAEIARAFDRMNERLSGTTADIRSRAARVDSSGRQVAMGSQNLAERTEQQSQSIHGTSLAIEQVTQAVALNAQAAREVDALSERLFAQAEEGNTAMAATLMAMDELQSSSSRINDMVAVIDDVAFHTGMLALNASVEAARAGASGKGFAVVAGEVRQLALRCAEAADEIRDLITASGAQVQDSSAKLQHVSVALDTLVNGVREVSGQLRVIASASTQQSAALQEVEANIKSLETITADNAALVEESTGASNALVAQGQALTASVATMRLRHGSADEARAMVERALAHVQDVGRKLALEHFNQDTARWVDRDLFIFALDRMGNIVANGMRRDRLGENVNTLDGLRGTHHSDRLWETASQGGGWVRYQIVNPSTGKLVSKESFVKLIDDETLIGCGCYSQGREERNVREMPASAVAWSRDRETEATA